MVESADGSDPTRRDYRFNVAAYELDKLLHLDLVPPSVERLVNGRPASLTWWVDDVAMNELERRRQAIAAPDPDSWNRQVDAVRVFDELISNTYRNTSPGLYLNTVWDNLLITKGWTIWLINHTASFRTRQRLEDPTALIRCPRTVLARLHELNREQLRKTMARYLSPQQLDALEIRRALLVRHFDDQIASKGEAAVFCRISDRARDGFVLAGGDLRRRRAHSSPPSHAMLTEHFSPVRLHAHAPRRCGRRHRRVLLATAFVAGLDSRAESDEGGPLRDGRLRGHAITQSSLQCE